MTRVLGSRIYFAAFAVMVGFIGGDGTDTSAAELIRYQATETHMAADFHIVLYSVEENTANQAIRDAFDRIAEVDRKLSNYRSDSELTLLCRTAPHALPRSVSEDFWRVLRAAHELSRKTEGAFDVTIGPVTKLWRRSRRRRELPDPSALQQSLDLVDFRLIEYDSERRAVTLRRRGMQLDLGGIAKGYAVDAALAAIRARGITRALVNGGGDIAVGDPPPNLDAWQVDIASLKPDANVSRRLKVANAAVATSGDAYQFVDIGDVRYSHIVDPRTGLGVTERFSVTVVAPTCMQADAWASALSVLGPPGLQLCQRQKKTDATITAARDDQITENQTPGFAEFVATEVGD